MDFFPAIRHGLKNILNFTGRDGRQTFWFFVLAVYILSIALTMVAMIPLMGEMFTAGIRAAQSGASEAEASGLMMSRMGGMFESIGWTSIATGVGMMFLLAASFVRRLHDSDLSGWWAAIPGAIYAYTLSQIPAQMAAMGAMLSDPEALAPQNPFALMQAQGSMALIAWIPIIIVVVLGVRRSSEGTNRSETEPVRS